MGESSRGLIVPKVRIFEIFVYIYLSKLVGSALFYCYFSLSIATLSIFGSAH